MYINAMKRKGVKTCVLRQRSSRCGTEANCNGHIYRKYQLHLYPQLFPRNASVADLELCISCTESLCVSETLKPGPHSTKVLEDDLADDYMADWLQLLFYVEMAMEHDMT